MGRSLIPESDGRSGLLGRESQLGSGSVALRLRVDPSEGQVDAWTSVVVLLRYLMLDKAGVILFGELKLEDGRLIWTFLLLGPSGILRNPLRAL